MSKKLIAVAAAAALALSALVATTSASALPVVGSEASGESYLSVTTTGTRAGAGTSGSPYTLQVPESGKIETTANVFSLSVSSTLKSRPVSVTTSNGIKVLDELGNSTNKYIASSGKDSLTLTTTSSGTTQFIAYPTKDSTGILTVAITAADGTVDTTQVFIKGLAGAAYSIKSVTPPTSVAPEGKGTFVASFVDVYGNAAIAAASDSAKVTVVGGGASTFASESATADRIGYSATTKRTAGVLTAGKVAGTIAVAMELLTPDATDAQIAAFGAPTRTYFTTLNSASLAGQITTLTTQVATLTTTVNGLKADYNALATKYNKLVKKSKRVVLK